MPTFNLGGQRIEVFHTTRGFIWSRSDGITVQVSPERHWWCLWLCQSTTSIERIQASVMLSSLPDPNTGAVQTANGSASCVNCGSLDVMGPSTFRFPSPPPQVFHSATFSGSVTIHGSAFPFSGTLTF